MSAKPKPLSALLEEAIANAGQCCGPNGCGAQKTDNKTPITKTEDTDGKAGTNS